MATYFEPTDPYKKSPGNYAKQKYLPGGSMIEAQAPAFPVRQTNSALLEALLRKRQPLGRAAVPPRQIQRSTPEVAVVPGAREAAAAEARARVIQANAVSQPQPLRMVGGPGIVPGYTPDVLAMSPIQRKLFLPSESAMRPGGADTMADAVAAQQPSWETQVAQRQSIEARGGNAYSGSEMAANESGLAEYLAAIRAAKKRG